MNKERVNILEVKSKAFALRIVRLYQYLRGKKESVLSKQILRSGTSIGANIAEGKYALQGRFHKQKFCCFEGSF